MAVLNDAVNLYIYIVVSEPFSQDFQNSSLQSFSSATMTATCIGEEQANSHWL
jgi:hypothetical protein